MLITTGIIASEEVLNVNLGNTVVSTVASCIGASQIKRMGRRPTNIWTAVACWFCFPLAFKNIGWHTYIVFIVWDLFEASVTYIFSVETKNHTLEELSEIFESLNPAKASLQKPLLLDS
ncbi:uncharacterized protein N7477_009668 [Penicillium maclennaniae]|uniref:uncharacterized protein n=1 Tax=Penicillium maclennaniae TaxID=1343394 RepID=UPI0025407D7F|nr:uncharacterized protein N7477_009668 [Penicillium maclennaniae]KAJ5662052.1 hypothetical protein N7477_009668 [Penicillium maclennaniae]